MRLVVALLIRSTHAVQFNDAFLGTWSPVNKSTPHAIIGPSGLMRNFAMTHDEKNGEYWMSAIVGQVFRIKNGLMQYCFAHVASSPFTVSAVTDSKIVFCYKTGERMHSHKSTDIGLAVGCDAAQIVLQLHSGGVLELTFYMSPPVKHAWVLLEKTGPAPPIAAYVVEDVFGGCDPTKPPPPTLKMGAGMSSMCPQLAVDKSMSSDLKMRDDDDDAASGRCRQLGTFLQGLISKENVDIRLQYYKPTNCWPCNMSYSVSAKIEADKYLAVAFKGMGYRFYEGMIPGSHKGHERPNYFGMATDPIDEERTGTVMVTGYPSGDGCVREMKAEHYTGAPTDVRGNPRIFNALVERKNGRTILRFTIEQHVGKTKAQVNAFFGAEQQAARVMWAIGDVRTPSPTPPPAVQYSCKVCAHIYDPNVDGGGVAFEELPDTWVCPVCGQPKSVYQPIGAIQQIEGECGEEIIMHQQGRRGVSPLQWFEQHPNCAFDPAEYGSLEQSMELV